MIMFLLQCVKVQGLKGPPAVATAAGWLPEELYHAMSGNHAHYTAPSCAAAEGGGLSSLLMRSGSRLSEAVRGPAVQAAGGAAMDVAGSAAQKAGGGVAALGSAASTAAKVGGATDASMTGFKCGLLSRHQTIHAVLMQPSTLM